MQPFSHSPVKYLGRTHQEFFFLSSPGEYPSLHSLHNRRKPAYLLCLPLHSAVAFVSNPSHIFGESDPYPMPRALPTRGPKLIQPWENML